MTRTSIIAAAALLAGSILTTNGAIAQFADLKRTELMQEDLSVPGRRVVQVRVDFAPGVVAGRHRHPGEELVYVIEGALEYQLDGRPPVTLKAGDTLFIPYGTP